MVVVGHGIEFKKYEICFRHIFHSTKKKIIKIGRSEVTGWGVVSLKQSTLYSNFKDFLKGDEI